MNDNQLANDFLKTLISKCNFDVNVQPPHCSPTAATKKLILDKYDLANYLASPGIRNLIVFIKNRIATKYEYEKIKKLTDKSKFADLPSILDRKAQQEKYEKLVSDNSILLV